MNNVVPRISGNCVIKCEHIKELTFSVRQNIVCISKYKSLLINQFSTLVLVTSVGIFNYYGITESFYNHTLIL